MVDVFDALEQEYDALEAMLASLDDAAWARPSLCAGWSVGDVVLHLVQSEESVGTSLGAAPAFARQVSAASTMDEVVDEWVRAERGAARADTVERWTKAGRAGLAALRAADPASTFPWATNPLKPRTLATTRLSEHWIHANDIAQPLGLAYPDTDRIWHIARLAHRTIPYAYARAGRDDPPAVRIELASPRGEEWVFGEAGAECAVRGSASELCRVAARRLAPAEARTLSASGERAAEVLGLVRTYA